MDRLTSDLNLQKAENKALRSENAVLKDSTLIGEKQREIELLRADHAETLDLLKELGQKLEGALADRDQLAEALAADDKQIDQRIADKVVQEREKLKNLEAKMAALTQRTSEDAAKYKELEVEKNFLSNEVDDLTNWKSIYESEHGLQELARNQRNLKGEICNDSFVHSCCLAQLYLVLISLFYPPPLLAHIFYTSFIADIVFHKMSFLHSKYDLLF